MTLANKDTQFDLKSLFDTFDVSLWHCNNPKLPDSSEIMRVPPDEAFLLNVETHSVMTPIMMNLWTGGWTLISGRKRLLAVRQLLAEGRGDGMIWVRSCNIDTKYNSYLSMIENAQRNNNPLQDFVDITNILTTIPGSTYASIAKAVGVSKTKVQTIDQTYAGCPPWAIQGALDGKIAITTVKRLSRMDKNLQVKAHDFFDENEKLTDAAISGLKKLRKAEFSQQFTAQLISAPTSTMGRGRPFIPRSEVLAVYEIMNNTELSLKTRLYQALPLIEALLK